jgi:hypothetical protein
VFIHPIVLVVVLVLVLDSAFSISKRLPIFEGDDEYEYEEALNS